MEQKNVNISRYSGLKFKDYLGYGFGDLGICLGFSLQSALIQNYYTDCLLLHPLFIMIMFVLARIWDGINDPMMGRIVDRMKPNRFGKYRRWFLYGCIPFAVTIALMFIKWPGFAPEGQTVVTNQNIGVYIYATITYVLFGMAMTAIQIPYGGLASVVTADQKERSRLGIWRSFGSSIGSLPVILVSSFAFKSKTVGGQKVNYVDYKILMIGIACMAAFAVLFLLLTYKFNKERVPIQPPQPKEKGAFKKAIGRMLHTRSMLSICVIAIFLLAGCMFLTGYYTYVIRQYFGASGFIPMLPSFFNVIAMFILMPFMQKAINRFGKKEVCIVGISIATLANILMLFLLFADRNAKSSIAIFLVLNFISCLGSSVINMNIWGMATDAIDDIQLRTGVREDGSCYAIYMFFRKCGQALSAVAINGSLLGFGYKFEPGKAASFTTEQLRTMFILGSTIPAALFGACALLFIFWYPLSKKKLEELESKKEAFFAKMNSKT